MGADLIRSAQLRRTKTIEILELLQDVVIYHKVG